MIKQAWQLLQQTFNGWLDDNAPRLGAALAFYSLLSLGPLLLLLVTAVGVIFGREAAEGQIVEQIGGIVGQEGAEVIQNVLKGISQSSADGVIARVFAYGALLVGASGVFGELQSAFNIIMKVPPREGQPILVFLLSKLFAFLLVFCCGVLLFASLALSATLTAVTPYIDMIMPGAMELARQLDIVISFATSIGIFGLLFKLVPARKISWESIWPGAALTSVLFVAGKILIGVYLTQSSMASAFGAAGSLVILLVWIYFSAQIIFFGAELTSVLAQREDAERHAARTLTAAAANGEKA